jgi:hypothetical protein
MHLNSTMWYSYNFMHAYMVDMIILNACITLLLFSIFSYHTTYEHAHWFAAIRYQVALAGGRRRLHLDYLVF